MNKQRKIQKLNTLSPRRCVPALALLLAFCASLAVTQQASALYILTSDSDSAVVLDETAPVTELRDFSSKLVYLNNTSVDGQELGLLGGQNVTVHCDGATLTARSRQETISALLSRLHIDPGPLDMVLVDLSGDGAVLTVSSDLTFYDQESEPVARNVVRVPSVYLPKGQEKVVEEGADGVRTAVYEVVYSGGELVSRQLVQELSCTSADQKVAVGTGVSSVSSSDRIASVTNTGSGGVLTFRSGDTMRFSAVKSVKATAYTTGYDGVGTRTATGTTVHVGSVAVDKNVIPLGSRLYVVTNDGSVIYGMAVAEDTGVRGNNIDLYYNTYQQCVNFGRRSATVYVLS